MIRTAVPPYQAPRWLPGGHLQTIWSALVPSPPPVPLRRERWNTPDEDFLDVDFLDGPKDSPLVILFHGLEGSRDSHYARALMGCLQERGWQGAVVHFRGCSGEENLLPRAYHSGDSAEIAWILARMCDSFPRSPRFACGVSLGGNALLKWLGEAGSGAAACLAGACAVSAPINLVAAGNHIDRGLNRHLYARRFLKSLIPKAQAKLHRLGQAETARKMRQVRTLLEFDTLYTAPVHGFRDGLDYWQRASSFPTLQKIGLPTLVLHARNDPFIPVVSLPTAADTSAFVQLHYTDEGGHVGFVTGPFPGRLDWLPRRILAFYDEVTPPSVAPACRFSDNDQ